MADPKEKSEFDLSEAAEDEEAEGTEFGEGEGLGEDGEGLVVNLDGVSEEGNFPVMPRAIYDVNLYELTYGLSQAKGNPMWTWIWEVENNAVEEYNGRRFYYHTTFNEGGKSRVKRALMRIKCEDDYNKVLLQSSFKPEDVALEGKLLGAKARLRVDIRPYQGKKSNNVRDILPPSEGGESSFLNA
jgi:hypothetical protein